MIYQIKTFENKLQKPNPFKSSFSTHVGDGVGFRSSVIFQYAPSAFIPIIHRELSMNNRSRLKTENFKIRIINAYKKNVQQGTTRGIWKRIEGRQTLYAGDILCNS